MIYCLDRLSRNATHGVIIRDEFDKHNVLLQSVTEDIDNTPLGQAITYLRGTFAEIEVDTETGVITVIKYIVAHDIGRAINPQTVEGQLEGGVVQGIGFALSEDFMVDKGTGETLSDSFATYKIPSALDIPEIEVILVEEPVSSGPFGAKGVGELPSIPTAPAICNAIYNAVGVRVYRLPIEPEWLLKEMSKKS